MDGGEAIGFIGWSFVISIGRLSDLPTKMSRKFVVAQMECFMYNKAFQIYLPNEIYRRV